MTRTLLAPLAMFFCFGCPPIDDYPEPDPATELEEGAWEFRLVDPVIDGQCGIHPLEIHDLELYAQVATPAPEAVRIDLEGLVLRGSRTWGTVYAVGSFEDMPVDIEDEPYPDDDYDEEYEEEDHSDEDDGTHEDDGADEEEGGGAPPPCMEEPEEEPEPSAGHDIVFDALVETPEHMSGTLSLDYRSVGMDCSIEVRVLARYLGEDVPSETCGTEEVEVEEGEGEVEPEPCG